MTVQTLNEDQLLTAMFDAVKSGDALAVSKLMSEDETKLEANDTDEGTPDNTPEEKSEETVAVNEEKSAEVKETTAEVKDDKTKATDGLPAWVEALPDDLKDQVLKDFQDLAGKTQYLEHYYRSTEGRIGAFQRKVDALQRELDTRKATPPPVKTEAAPSPKLEDDPELARLKEEDPALYSVMKKREDALLRQASDLVEKTRAELNSTLETKLAPVHKQQELDYVRQQQEYVLSVIPNAREVINSEHWQYFEKNATPAVKKLIDSKDGEEVILAIQLYDNWLRTSYPESAASDEHVVAETKQVESKPEVVSKVAEDRQRKLQTGAVAHKDSVKVQTGIADPESAIEDLFQKIWKEKGYDRFSQVNTRK